MDLTIYNSVRPNVRSGDIIFFNAIKGETASVIERFTDSAFSHVGMFLIGTVPQDSERRIFIVESTSLSESMDVSGNYAKGIQMSAASQRLDGFPGKAFWASLKQPLTEEEIKELSNWLFQRCTDKVGYDYGNAILSGFADKAYKRGLIGWLGKLIIKIFHPKEAMRKVFCSELVTKSLQLVGRVDSALDPIKQTPRDVSLFNCFNPLIPLFITDFNQITIS